MLVVDDEKESPLLSRREESAGWVAGDPRASTIIMPPLDPWKNANAHPPPRGRVFPEPRTAEQSVVRRCTCDKWDGEGGGIRLLSKLIGSLTTIIRVEEGVEYLTRSWNLLSFFFFKENEIWRMMIFFFFDVGMLKNIMYICLVSLLKLKFLNLLYI